MKATGAFPLGTLPVMEINGIKYTQSNALTRYIGKLANLYPHDVLLAFRVDEIMDIVEDGFAALVPTLNMGEAERKVARTKIIAADGTGALHNVAALLAQRHKENGGSVFMVGNSVTIADLKAAAFVEAIATGFLEPEIGKTWLPNTFKEFHAAFYDKVVPIIVIAAEKAKDDAKTT